MLIWYHEGLQHAGPEGTASTMRLHSNVDLNMRYHSMALSKAVKKLCMTCLPWGLYQYNILPMRVNVVTDIFQEAMCSLFNNLEGVIVHLDDISIIGSASFEEHMKIVSEVL